MAPEAIAGTISSSMFAVGNIPMLVKAARTRSLSSYSHHQLTMVGAANVIHWFYISSLPVGPIWFLHGFHTVATAMMIVLYVRYEVRAHTAIGCVLDGLRFGGRLAVRWSARGALVGLLLLGGVSRSESAADRVNDEPGWTSALSGGERLVAAPRRWCGRVRSIGGRARSCGWAEPGQ